MGIKVTVVGGGSTYTPELVEGIANRADRFPVDELVLLDTDPMRREVVGGLAGRMLRRMAWPGRLLVTDDRDSALDGADFILLQLRVGGQAARLVDETLPVRFGTIGQETTGAGGFAKALRTVPVVLEIADEVRQRSATGAWIVDFTNPVGIVTQALLDASHRALGLCNVAIGLQRRFAERFSVTPEEIELGHVGLNHLSWERSVRVAGVDRLPEMLDGDGAELAEEMGLPIELMRRQHAIPSYYLRYYYLFDEVLREQRKGHSRAAEVMEIESRLLEMYRDPTLDEKPALLADRGGAYYSEAAAHLMASLADGRGDVQVVDLRNEGALSDLPGDAVVEIPARIDRDGAHPLPQEPMSDELRELVLRVKAYERLVVEAIRTHDRDTVLRALTANPLVGPYVDAEPLLTALLEANREFLPEFA